ncbi:hypothetical protein ACFQ60_46800 [Streptomyces zhihengii]|uniref:Secreted protein n=1 Tax=Streptomyces zhihengii TaxID=1818004 RepID=A0ABS2V4Q9_9ACTN|nr:hypothetical protein [Streptomyces zhihengii]MBM9624831.1 hypothetical protein [Streptomyces zhihengii]
MDTEVLVAIVGGGAALLGAAVGGAGAVVAAHITGKRAESAARHAYLGPLDVARRTAQREAYVGLLTAAHALADAGGEVLESARRLAENANEEIIGQPTTYPLARIAADRERVRAVQPADEVIAAARHVELEGPESVAKAARQLSEAALDFEEAIELVETPEGDDHAITAGPSVGRVPLRHGVLRRQIWDFAREATAHLNQR